MSPGRLPEDPSLAATLDSRAGGTLVSLGIAPPQPPPAPAKPAAAFAKAAAMGVTVEGVSSAMAPVKAKKSSS